MIRRDRIIIGVVVIAAIASSAALALYMLGTPKPTPSNTQNFLIIANFNGFNDSVDHGAPQSSWPVIHVDRGASVNITVYNLDHQAHGFQITHYFDSTIQSVAPGQKLSVIFVANQAGTFRMYCDIFCTVHTFMQSGELVVS